MPNRDQPRQPMTLTRPGILVLVTALIGVWLGVVGYLIVFCANRG